MKLGLVRHYKVIINEKNILSASEFAQAMEKYDTSPVQENGLVINSSEWDICYCSTLARARTTAESVYNKEIIFTDLLVEVPISPFTKFNIKLPSFMWHIGARIAWYFSHNSQRESISGTQKRIEQFYELISKSGHKNILVVAHGYFLRMFYNEMKKMGFMGEVDVNIQNGKLYKISKAK